MWTCAVPSLSRLRACFVKQVRCVNCTLQPDETLQVSCPAASSHSSQHSERYQVL